MKPNLHRLLLLTAGIFTLFGNGVTASTPTPAKPGAVAERTVAEFDAILADYYKANNDFFFFESPDKIPANLVWQNGAELPEIGSPEAKKGGTYYQRLQDFPRTLRTVGPDANNAFRTYILDDSRMYLAKRHPNQTEVGPTGFSYFPGVAKEWSLDKTTKTVFVRIDPDARWSDGVPITADDMLFIFYFYQSKDINEPWYNNWYGKGVNYSKVTKYDTYTFSITLKESRPDILSRVLEIEPYPKHFFKDLGPDYESRYQWKYVPTSGPYIIQDKDIKKGSTIAMTRIPNWWAKDKKFWRYRYNFDRIQFIVIKDTAKTFEVFRKGELDAFGMTTQSEYWYDKLPNTDDLVKKGYINKYKFYNDIPRPTYGLWMNTSTPLLSNKDIRIGINYATNFQVVCDKYFRGDATRMRSNADGYGDFSHPTLTARPFDVDKALESFSKAGFTKRGDDGILVNEKGERLSVQLTTGYENLREVLTIICEEAKNAGLELRAEVLDSTAGWKKAQEKKHEIMLSAFAVSPEMYPRFWETWHSDNAYDKPYLEDGSVNPARKPKTQTNNLCCYANPEFDKLIAIYDNSESAAEMKTLAFKMEEIIKDDACFVPGWVNPFIRIASWRWVKWPEDFNVKLAQTYEEWFLMWIDEAERAKTKKAMKSGDTFPAIIKTVDKYRVK
ncbi:MAG: extracellular solute-binding protein [Verrucomicrobiota bacterium]|nr:extracellular solute-binding protein [Verrucomicrobiota bacterium]